VDLGLQGKVAVITGGSMGIGLAVAQGLAAEGVHVAICARDEARVIAAAQGIREQYPVRVLGVRADVSIPADLDAFVGAIDKAFGGVDILINNAGEGSAETILSAPDERWQYYLDVHLMAAVRLSRALIPSMKARGSGVILNNGSICATQPLYNEPIYNTAKAALAMFSKCLAHEVIADNIRVNLINPGLIQTNGWIGYAKQQTKGTDQTWGQHLTGIAQEKAPIGRFATPEELADFFVFMCSPRASYCVGSSYYVDGGWLNVVT